MTFKSDLMAKADRIRELAVEKRFEEFSMPGIPLFPGPEWDSVETNYDYISGMFEPFTVGDPAAFDTIAGSLDDMVNTLAIDPPTEMTTASRQLDSWDGAAAEAFKVAVMDKFDQYHGLQRNMTDELIVINGTMRDLLAETRVNITDIADSTVETLEALEAPGGGDDGGGAVAFAVLTVAAIGLTVASAGAGTPAASAGLALLAGGTSFAASQVPTAPESAIGGGSVDEVLRSMHSAIADLWEALHSRTEGMKADIETDIEHVEALREAAMPGRPDVADQPKGRTDEFYVVD